MKEPKSQEEKKTMYLHYIETAGKLEERAYAVLEVLQEVGEVTFGRYDTVEGVEYDLKNEAIRYRIEDYEGDDEYLDYPFQYLWIDDEDIKKDIIQRREDIKKDIIQRREERLKKEAAEKAETERLCQEAAEKAERALYERLKQKYETEDKQ